jgi:hypothetical protein
LDGPRLHFGDGDAPGWEQRVSLLDPLGQVPTTERDLSDSHGLASLNAPPFMEPEARR